MKRLNRIVTAVGIILIGSSSPIFADTVRLTSSSETEPSSFLPIEVATSHEIVAVQFKILYSNTQGRTGAVIPRVQGNSDHSVKSLEKIPGERVVVVHSPTNSVFPESFDLQVPLASGNTNSPSSYEMQITEIIFSDAQGNSYPVETGYELVDAWFQQNFTPSQLADREISGESKDPDFDGIPNLLELASGSDPLVHSSDSNTATGDPTLTTDSEGTYITLKFWRSKDPEVRQLVEATAVASFNLEKWTTKDVTEQRTGRQTARAEEIQAKVSVLPGEARYLRVEAKKIEQ